MAERNPAAFMSYLRRVDEHDRGRLTELRKQLEGEVHLHTGEDFTIFQDHEDIAWGQQWRSRIQESLNDVTFLIPIITPGFFNSKPCREEVELFLQREKDLGRSDLILPIYYIDYPDFNDTERRSQDPLMAEIARHQYEDWRELRHESLTSAAIGRRLSKLAEALRDALARRRPAALASAGSASERSRAPHQQEPTRSPDSASSGTAPAAEAGRQARASVVAKPEPPILVVDPFHRGDHTSITEAIRAAGPGTIIMVEPGLYRERLVIDKPLEINGQGEVGDVVVEAKDTNVIRAQATMGRVANLTLRQLGGLFFAVDITQGRLDLEDCDITSRGLACVAIRNGADPRLRRNRIHGGKEGGVLVCDEGRGTLEDNDIFANALTGVEIRSGGDPTLRRNRIHGGKEGGVLVCDEGRGTLDDNDIFANALAGVEIRSGGDPTLRRNRVHDNKGSGVYVGTDGRGTVEGNDLRNNQLGAWDIAEESGDKVIRRNNQE